MLGLKILFSLMVLSLCSLQAYAGYSEGAQRVIKSLYQDKNVTIVTKSVIDGHMRDCEQGAKKGRLVFQFNTKNVIGGQYTHTVYKVSNNNFCEVVFPGGLCECFQVHYLNDE